MSVNPQKVGNQICALRKIKKITQAELGERLSVSFQAVSKWERGEALPDTAILVNLANVLETTVDNILNGGEKIINYKGKIAVSDMKAGIECIEKMGNLLGKNNIIYRSAIQGINEKMNMEVEDCLADDYKREALLAEAIIQNIIAGAYVDITDIKNNFKYEHFSNIVCSFAKKYGIS